MKVFWQDLEGRYETKYEGRWSESKFTGRISGVSGEKVVLQDALEGKISPKFEVIFRKPYFVGDWRDGCWVGYGQMIELVRRLSNHANAESSAGLLSDGMEGVIRYVDGTCYDGEVSRAFIPHGRGKWSQDGACLYEGTWDRGLPTELRSQELESRRELQCANGLTWVHERLSVRGSEQVRRYLLDDQGMLSGPCMLATNGRVFSGQMREGKANGRGTLNLFRDNGKDVHPRFLHFVIKGIWEDDRLVKGMIAQISKEHAKCAEGIFSPSGPTLTEIFNAESVETWRNLYEYVFSFQLLEATGQGYSSAPIVFPTVEGDGAMRYVSSVGNWKDGQLVGPGTCLWVGRETAALFEGQWENGQLVGNSILSIQGSRPIKGEFRVEQAGGQSVLRVPFRGERCWDEQGKLVPFLKARCTGIGVFSNDELRQLATDRAFQDAVEWRVLAEHATRGDWNRLVHQEPQSAIKLIVELLREGNRHEYPALRKFFAESIAQDHQLLQPLRDDQGLLQPRFRWLWELGVPMTRADRLCVLRSPTQSTAAQWKLWARDPSVWFADDLVAEVGPAPYFQITSAFLENLWPHDWVRGLATLGRKFPQELEGRREGGVLPPDLQRLWSELPMARSEAFALFYNHVHLKQLWGGDRYWIQAVQNIPDTLWPLLWREMGRKELLEVMNAVPHPYQTWKKTWPVEAGRFVAARGREANGKLAHALQEGPDVRTDLSGNRGSPLGSAGPSRTGSPDSDSVDVAGAHADLAALGSVETEPVITHSPEFCRDLERLTDVERAKVREWVNHFHLSKRCDGERSSPYASGWMHAHIYTAQRLVVLHYQVDSGRGKLHLGLVHPGHDMPAGLDPEATLRKRNPLGPTRNPVGPLDDWESLFAEPPAAEHAAGTGGSPHSEPVLKVEEVQPDAPQEFVSLDGARNGSIVSNTDAPIGLFAPSLALRVAALQALRGLDSGSAPEDCVTETDVNRTNELSEAYGLAQSWLDDEFWQRLEGLLELARPVALERLDRCSQHAEESAILKRERLTLSPDEVRRTLEILIGLEAVMEESATRAPGSQGMSSHLPREDSDGVASTSGHPLPTHSSAQNLTEFVAPGPAVNQLGIWQQQMLKHLAESSDVEHEGINGEQEVSALGTRLETRLGQLIPDSHFQEILEKCQVETPNEVSQCGETWKRLWQWDAVARRMLAWLSSELDTPGAFREDTFTPLFPFWESGWATREILTEVETAQRVLAAWTAAAWTGCSAAELRWGLHDLRSKLDRTRRAAVEKQGRFISSISLREWDQSMRELISQRQHLRVPMEAEELASEQFAFYDVSDLDAQTQQWEQQVDQTASGGRTVGEILATTSFGRAYGSYLQESRGAPYTFTD